MKFYAFGALICSLIFPPVALAERVVSPNQSWSQQGDYRNDLLDHGGERIPHRLGRTSGQIEGPLSQQGDCLNDRMADRSDRRCHKIEKRLDRKGHQIEDRLDPGERLLERRWDGRGDRPQHRVDQSIHRRTHRARAGVR